jgi:hypothetical protein
MTDKPDPNNNVQVAWYMNLLNCGETEAREVLRYMRLGYDIGRKDGQAEAQRFFRLALGVEEPNPGEAAFWNNPVPLKEVGT